MSTSSHLVGASAEAAGRRIPIEAGGALASRDSSIATRFGALPAGTDVQEVSSDSGDRIGTICFESNDADPVEQRLTPVGQNEFKLDFCRDMTRLDQWAAAMRWPAASVSKFHVVVSSRYKISKSLVPAWSGRAGAMEFPLWRVAARKAAIAHELVHVFFPNGNRLLAEGLAVYLQAALGSNPAFPNFGKPLHALVRERLPDMVPGYAKGQPSSLEPLRLADLDGIATPNPLTLRVGQDFYGEEPRGQARIYPIAGSFIQFLIETRGLQKFRALYLQTPLVTLAQNPGSPDRWRGVYGQSLADLEAAWKSSIARCDEVTIVQS